MPATHTIDREKMLITTTWSGDATDEELVDAIISYQREVKGSEYREYNELVDLSGVADFQLTTAGIQRLVQIAARTDQENKTTRLALVVGSSFAFGLARMYEIYRGLVPKANKVVRVFHKREEAEEWFAC